jgi:TonB family protein
MLNASLTAAQAATIGPITLGLAAGVVLLLLAVARRLKSRRPGGSQEGTSSSTTEGGASTLSGVLLASRPERDVQGTARTTAGAVLIHACMVALLVWATAMVGIEAETDEQVTVIELPPEAPPPPPPPVARVQEVAPPVEVAKGFQTLSVPDIVPPDIPPPQIGVKITEADYSGVGREGGRADGKEGAPPTDDLTVAPTFTPFTVAPELKNTEEVQRALVRSYPPLLRDAGIGGTVLMWFLIDETGKVVKTQVKESSGHQPRDEAAERVAEVMKFSPAINRDRRVIVWVALPIVFSTR